MTWELILLIAIIAILGFIFLWASSMKDMMACQLESIEAKLAGLNKRVAELKYAVEESTKAPIFEGERSTSAAKIIDPGALPEAEFGEDLDDWHD